MWSKARCSGSESRRPRRSICERAEYGGRKKTRTSSGESKARSRTDQHLRTHDGASRSSSILTMCQVPTVLRYTELSRVAVLAERESQIPEDLIRFFPASWSHVGNINAWQRFGSRTRRERGRSRDKRYPVATMPRLNGRYAPLKSCCSHSVSQIRTSWIRLERCSALLLSIGALAAGRP